MKVYRLFKQYRLQILLMLAASLFCALYSYRRAADTDLRVGKVRREDYAGEDKELVLQVEGLSDEVLSLDLALKKRQYTREEADAVFERCMDIVVKELAGQNTSLQEVKQKLHFLKYIEEYGVDVRIIPEDSNLISAKGEVFNVDLPKPADSSLRVRLQTDLHEAYFNIPVRVCPADLSEQEKRLLAFRQHIRQEDEKQKFLDYLQLPMKWEGRSLSYRVPQENKGLVIMLFAALVSLLLHMQKRQKMKEEKKRIQRQALLEYPEIISKFIVFLEAGLSVRNIWDRVVEDYEKSSQGEKKQVYEEMKKAALRLRSGIHEALVYKDFSRSIGLRQYMKFMSILEQNRRTGLSNLKEILHQECKAAWEERIHLAKRQGQELGTKLLLPLFMMLLVVLALVIAPAMMNIY